MGKFDGNYQTAQDENLSFDGAEVELKFGPITSLSFKVRFRLKNPRIILAGTFLTSTNIIYIRKNRQIELITSLTNTYFSLAHYQSWLRHLTFINSK